MVTEEVKPKVVQENLEYLLDQYERHIKLHKMKYKTGMLEIALTTVAKVAESFMTLKWGDLVKTLFDVQRQRFALTLAESQVPGQEVAYISKAKSKFDTVLNK